MFCYQKNFFEPTLPVDEAQFYALVRATRWNESIDKFRETGDPKLKRGLPAFVFQATFDETISKKGRTGRWRKQSATRLTGMVVMDVDHLQNEELSVKHEEFTSAGFAAKARQWGILLVYVTPSGRGLKIVFKARKDWGNLIDNQHRMAAVLGVTVDESCKDASRMSFICKESDILYIDKELFTYENGDYSERYTAQYREGKSRGESGIKNEEIKINNGTLTFKGRPYADIIAEWWRRQGGEPQEGERNVKLYQLAASLRAICDNSPQKLLMVMPDLGLDSGEMTSIVESACKEPVKGMSRLLTDILANNGEETKNNSQCATAIGQCPLDEWGAQIAAMFDDFPLLRDICRGLRSSQYPAALFVGGGLLMTLMTRCTYRFYHRPEELRRLNNSTLIIGDPAAGKSFATRLYKLITVPIAEADQVGKDAINAYRELLKTKGANKDKPKKPRVTIRIHPARTSNAQFIQDMVNAVEDVDGVQMQLHMLTFDTELDNTLALQRGGAYIDKQALELKAFHNEEDGQFYANVDSVVQNFNVVWNYIYTGTPLALKRKVNEQNFGTGLATRLTCIPLPPTNFEMLTRERDIDNESDERLTMWARRLDRTKGELSVQHIVDELYEWTARRMADAKDNDSRADEMLLKRCAYHGLNFAAPFIVMRHWDTFSKDGELWSGTFETDDTDWRLAELIVNMQYACQRHFFGALAEAYFDNKLKDASANVQHRQKTVEGFNRLPEEFTNEDVMRVFGMSSVKSASAKVNRLMKDHLIEKSDTFIENGTMKAKYRKIL